MLVANTQRMMTQMALGETASESAFDGRWMQLLAFAAQNQSAQSQSVQSQPAATTAAAPEAAPEKTAAVDPAERLHDLDNPKAKSVERIVDYASKHYGVPKRIIHAVIKAESSYNPKATSPVGAQGLMQLMPGTAKELGVSDAYDPFQNVMGGTRYLRQLLDRYDGNLRNTLAAYNWGPHRVDKYGTQRLPDETRGYLARIHGLLTHDRRTAAND
ncbi:MAG: lytic transglycosylase domain-containing protein [Deltaproteobacteria bacterium]|nr:lytic transglycosylase domain-containing protein [Deltaproteobacteria bacterium]MCB9479689.1 lytic transglycosylase domain-containing protein [Deltaproteobacteria bacterium]MCB9488020.1 lytic transglycosylase domain-containing protein [Deltaproteobacteria bacterium]